MLVNQTLTNIPKPKQHALFEVSKVPFDGAQIDFFFKENVLCSDPELLLFYLYNFTA